LDESFASHPKSQFWSDKNTVKPYEIPKNTYKKYYFNCNICNHEIYVRIGEIINFNLWCIYCANKKLCDNENCKICFEKSFASHPLSKYWSLNNPKTPRQVGKGTEVKYEFNCICGHTYKKELYSITTATK
jgi:hypothetical protein